MSRRKPRPSIDFPQDPADGDAFEYYSVNPSFPASTSDIHHVRLVYCENTPWEDLPPDFTGNVKESGLPAVKQWLVYTNGRPSGRTRSGPPWFSTIHSSRPRSAKFVTRGEAVQYLVGLARDQATHLRDMARQADDVAEALDAEFKKEAS